MERKKKEGTNLGINAPPGYTIHHRKRLADGGDDSDGNKSFVLPAHHQAFNILFDRFSNDKKVLLLERYWHKFGEGKAVLIAREIVLNLLKSQERRRSKKLYNAKGLKQIRKLMGVSKSEAKKVCAWILLFDDLPLERIVEIFNEIWLDPDFEFVIRTTGSPKIAIVNRK